MTDRNGQHAKFMWRTGEVSALVTDADGKEQVRTLRQNIVVRGKAPADFVYFTAGITAKIADLPDGKSVHRTRSDNIVEGKTVDEAFANLEAMIPAVRADIRREAFAEAQQAQGKPTGIVTATQLPPGLPPYGQGPRHRRRR